MEIALKGTFLDVYLRAMVVPLQKEHNKCPGGGGEVLKEFLGGDVLLGPWNP